jgi:hypothetical protein
VAAERPSPEDRLEGWFDPVTTARLTQAGMVLLRDLQQRIQGGGHWWRGCRRSARSRPTAWRSICSCCCPTACCPRPGHSSAPK